MYNDSTTNGTEPQEVAEVGRGLYSDLMRAWEEATYFGQ